MGTPLQLQSNIPIEHHDQKRRLGFPDNDEEERYIIVAGHQQEIARSHAVSAVGSQSGHSRVIFFVGEMQCCNFPSILNFKNSKISAGDARFLKKHMTRL